MKIGILIGRSGDKWQVIGDAGEVGQLRGKLDKIVAGGGKVTKNKVATVYNEIRLVNGNAREAILKRVRL